MVSGDYGAGHETAAEAAAIGERFGDADLVWLARDEQGRALVNQGRVKEGLRLVDELLLIAAAGELSPVVTGIVYCNTIAFCWSVYGTADPIGSAELGRGWRARYPAASSISSRTPATCRGSTTRMELPPRSPASSPNDQIRGER